MDCQQNETNKTGGDGIRKRGGILSKMLIDDVHEVTAKIGREREPDVRPLLPMEHVKERMVL